MRFSELHAPTLRQAPAEAELISHQLLLRGGYVRKLAAGIYCYLPLGLRVLRRIERIVREEMDCTGAQEVLLPAMQPIDLWHETGRYDDYGDLLVKLSDRQGRRYCLGPTHEEVVTDLMRHELRSYKQLPLLVYQIQTKYRDELRPRGGLIRGREFLMKDLYSFDADRAGLDESYEKVYEGYCRVFDRCGVEYHIVEAEGGAVGGSETREFMVAADAGEDEMLLCRQCGYAANRESAAASQPQEAPPPSADAPAPEMVETPGMTTVGQVTAFLRVEANQLIKTLIYTDANGGLVAGLVRGDRDLNEAKLARAADRGPLVMADPATVERTTRAAVGFAGPIGLEGVRLIADHEVMAMSAAVTGANADDAHLRNVVPGRDFQPDLAADIRTAADGDPCPKCRGAMELARCIELGHVFKLGVKYSAAMQATYLDEHGEEKLLEMGCYGIGISRIMQAVAEVSHDDRGPIWPASIAPFDVHILLLDPQEETCRQAAEALYAELTARSVDALYDDRDERAGVKFADADLVGAPWQVIIGRKTRDEGVVEVRARGTKDQELVPVSAAADSVCRRVTGAQPSPRDG